MQKYIKSVFSVSIITILLTVSFVGVVNENTINNNQPDYSSNNGNEIINEKGNNEINEANTLQSSTRGDYGIDLSDYTLIGIKKLKVLGTAGNPLSGCNALARLYYKDASSKQFCLVYKLPRGQLLSEADKDNLDSIEDQGTTWTIATQIFWRGAGTNEGSEYEIAHATKDIAYTNQEYVQGHIYMDIYDDPNNPDDGPNLVKDYIEWQAKNLMYGSLGGYYPDNSDGLDTTGSIIWLMHSAFLDFCTGDIEITEYHMESLIWGIIWAISTIAFWLIVSYFVPPLSAPGALKIGAALAAIGIAVSCLFIRDIDKDEKRLERPTGIFLLNEYTTLSFLPVVTNRIYGPPHKQMENGQSIAYDPKSPKQTASIQSSERYWGYDTYDWWENKNQILDKNHYPITIDSYRWNDLTLEYEVPHNDERGTEFRNVDSSEDDYPNFYNFPSSFFFITYDKHRISIKLDRTTNTWEEIDEHFEEDNIQAKWKGIFDPVLDYEIKDEASLPTSYDSIYFGNVQVDLTIPEPAFIPPDALDGWIDLVIDDQGRRSSGSNLPSTRVGDSEYPPLLSSDITIDNPLYVYLILPQKTFYDFILESKPLPPEIEFVMESPPNYPIWKINQMPATNFIHFEFTIQFDNGGSRGYGDEYELGYYYEQVAVGLNYLNIDGITFDIPGAFDWDYLGPVLRPGFLGEPEKGTYIPPDHTLWSKVSLNGVQIPQSIQNEYNEDTDEYSVQIAIYFIYSPETVTISWDGPGSRIDGKDIFSNVKAHLPDLYLPEPSLSGVGVALPINSGSLDNFRSWSIDSSIEASVVPPKTLVNPFVQWIDPKYASIVPSHWLKVDCTEIDFANPGPLIKDIQNSKQAYMIDPTTIDVQTRTSSDDTFNLRYGESLNFIFTVINTGGCTDTFDLSATIDSSTPNVQTILRQDEINLAPTESVDVELEIQSRNNVASESPDTITFEVKSQLDSNEKSTKSFKVMPLEALPFNIDSSAHTVPIAPGSSTTYNIQFSNPMTRSRSGDYTVHLDLEPNIHFNYAHRESRVSLFDWTASLDKIQIEIGPGETEIVQLEVMAPPDAEEGRVVSVDANGYLQKPGEQVPIYFSQRYTSLIEHNAPSNWLISNDEIIYQQIIYANDLTIEDDASLTLINSQIIIDSSTQHTIQLDGNLYSYASLMSADIENPPHLYNFDVPSGTPDDDILLLSQSCFKDFDLIRNIDISSEITEITIPRGTEEKFIITIDNNGNWYEDAFIQPDDIPIDWIIYVDDNPEITTDNSEETSFDYQYLHPIGIQNIANEYVVIKPHSNCVPGDYYITIECFSLNDDSIQDSITFTITVTT